MRAVARPPQSPARWPLLPGAVARVLTGLAVAVAALVALGAVVGDATPGLMLVNVASWWLLLAVTGAGVLLAVGRRPVPAAVCLLLGLLLVSPYRAAGTALTTRPVAARTPVTTVATYNIAGGEPDMDERLERLTGLVRREHPDVVLVQEVDAPTADALRGGALLRHAWVGRPNAFHQRVAVLSRWPLTEIRDVATTVGARPTAVVEVKTPYGPLQILPLHLPSPCYCLQPTRLAAEARARRAATEAALDALGPGPAIIGGDLNSGSHNDPARALRRAGLVDAFETAGSGPGFTRFQGLLGFRIDALFLRGLTPQGARTGAADGSDHRPLVVELVR